MTPEQKKAMSEGRQRARLLKSQIVANAPKLNSIAPAVPTDAKHDPRASAPLQTIPPAVQSKLDQMPESFRASYLSAISGLSRANAVDSFCRECMGWINAPENVRGCTSPACPLFPYRPYRP